MEFTPVVLRARVLHSLINLSDVGNLIRSTLATLHGDVA